MLAALEWLNGIEIVQHKVHIGDATMYRYRPGSQSRLHDIKLDPRFLKLLDDVSTTWKDKPLETLLDHVYALPDFKSTGFGDALLDAPEE